MLTRLRRSLVMFLNLLSSRPEVLAALVALSALAPVACSKAKVPLVATQSLELVAELIDRGERVPACGFLHLAVVMRYRPISVSKGSFSGENLYVVHGCPDMPRRSYGADAGTLQAFRVGDRHHLVLSRLPLPDWPPQSGPDIVDGFENKLAPRYRAMRTDMALAASR